MVKILLILLKDLVLNIKSSLIRTQPKNTSVCGQYCLYFAYKICNGEKMENIIKSMESPEHILNFVKRNFKYCKRSNCSLFQSCTKC